MKFVLKNVATFIERQLPNTLLKNTIEVSPKNLQNNNVYRTKRTEKKEETQNTTTKLHIVELYIDSDHEFLSPDKNASLFFSFFSSVRFQQITLVIFAIAIIFLVEKIYAYNSKLFGTINVLPGIGVVCY